MKKRMQWTMNVLAGAVLTAALCGSMGCESEDSPDTGGIHDYFDRHPYVSDRRSSGTVGITAGADTLETDGDKTVLQAAGGRQPYRWSVEDATLGALSSSSGQNVVYTRIAAGDNAVRCRDSAGKTAHLVIQQP